MRLDRWRYGPVRVWALDVGAVTITVLAPFAGGILGMTADDIFAVV